MVDKLAVGSSDKYDNSNKVRKKSFKKYNRPDI